MLNARFGGTTKELKEQQHTWIALRNQCKTSQCLVEAYRKRVDETCDYAVVSGVHPVCTMSEEIEWCIENYAGISWDSLCSQSFQLWDKELDKPS
jgi:uncharacterized protein